jgi:hypothetical protein
MNLEEQQSLGKMPPSGILRRVAVVRTHVSEEFNASIIKVERIGELGATFPITRNRNTLQTTRQLLIIAKFVLISPILVNLMTETLHSSETSVLKRSTQLNIP